MQYMRIWARQRTVVGAHTRTPPRLSRRPRRKPRPSLPEQARIELGLGVSALVYVARDIGMAENEETEAGAWSLLLPWALGNMAGVCWGNWCEEPGPGRR